MRAKIDAKLFHSEIEANDYTSIDSQLKLQAAENLLEPQSLYEAFLVAYSKQKIAIATLLLNYWRNIDKDKILYKAIYVLIRNNDIKMLEFFISNGIDIHAPFVNKNCITALTMAVNMRNSNVTEFLLKTGADYSSMDTLGKNAVTYATQNNQFASTDHSKKILNILERVQTKHENNKDKALLIKDKLSRDITSFFSIPPRDIIDYVLVPMLNSRRFIDVDHAQSLGS